MLPTFAQPINNTFLFDEFNLFRFDVFNVNFKNDIIYYVEPSGNQNDIINFSYSSIYQKNYSLLLFITIEIILIFIWLKPTLSKTFIDHSIILAPLNALLILCSKEKFQAGPFISKEHFSDIELITESTTDWQTVRVPMSLLTSTGLDITKVNTGLVIWAKYHNNNHFRIDDVRFEP